MNIKWLAVFGLCPLIVQAEYISEKNSSFSIGYSQLMLKEGSFKEDLNGIGFSGVSFKQKKNIGFVVSADYFQKDMVSGDTAEIWDLTVGPAFRFDDINWLRVYPLIGASFSSFEPVARDTDKVHFTVGFGTQFHLGESGMLIDINYKKIDMEIDSNMLFIGLGYAF
ncbi:putative exported protein [Aliivibrio wodanis]|uniref:Putative exported protein n=1 Tax=Aliivibrio wodanis TaxID=80852 RepID=A0A090I707_9GAMM|nr:putative exported protein [Aliivibrio wodanis]VVV05876.1 hypothetical protein AW0309160_03359 [Aliivibrio wodanis]